MKFQSTRDSGVSIDASQAILQGLSPDGGLYIADSFPTFAPDEIKAFGDMGYAQAAAAVIGRYVNDYSASELSGFASKAYSASRWLSAGIAPLTHLDGGISVLELFHGPTCAFKDFALQMLPMLLMSAAKKAGAGEKIAILTATSGDTGKAAIEGFADVGGAAICVFYPEHGTSDIQKLQMTTSGGGNVMVYGVRGNFDDAQSGVKRIFGSSEFARELGCRNIRLSSANSINWGRLAPQTAYYFTAYASLVKAGRIKPGDEMNVCVPSGNFGDILAGYIAKLSGLPVGALVCAANKNNVLADFLGTGVYDSKRPFHATMSPSMDILVSSNVERLLFLLSGRDGARTRSLMEDLALSGKFDIAGSMHENLKKTGFDAGYCGEDDCLAEIKSTFENEKYLMDPHTAVAMRVYREYVRRTGDSRKAIVLSTASPFKFASSVLSAIGPAPSGDGFAMLKELSSRSGLAVPPGLKALEGADERFKEVVDPRDMQSAVARWLAR